MEFHCQLLQHSVLVDQFFQETLDETCKGSGELLSQPADIQGLQSKCKFLNNLIEMGDEIGPQGLPKTNIPGFQSRPLKVKYKTG